MMNIADEQIAAKQGDGNLILQPAVNCSDTVPVHSVKNIRRNLQHMQVNLMGTSHSDNKNVATVLAGRGKVTLPDNLHKTEIASYL